VERRLAGARACGEAEGQVSRRRIDKSVLAKLGRAAAENAIALANEADLLDENDHRARAFALTVLAAEELGKAFTCAMVEANADDAQTWESFWAVLEGPQRHTTKLAANLYLELQLLSRDGPPSMEGLAEGIAHLAPQSLDAAKMRSLYVDLDGEEVLTAAEMALDAEKHARARALRRSVVGWAVAVSVGFEADYGPE
jgi:AbiV family abortive infection protein